MYVKMKSLDYTELKFQNRTLDEREREREREREMNIILLQRIENIKFRINSGDIKIINIM